MANVISKRVVASGRFLSLEEITFVNDEGRTVKWEAAQRTGGAQAVSIFTLKEYPGEGWKFVFVRQFRAPVGRYCVENPAGIVEPGESVEEAAKRELLEETGYHGRIVYVGFPTESSAGMTGELVTPVVAVVDDTPENSAPRQDLDESESIEVIEVPSREIDDRIEEMRAAGDCISGRLMSFIIGLKCQGC